MHIHITHSSTHSIDNHHNALSAHTVHPFIHSSPIHSLLSQTEVFTYLTDIHITQSSASSIYKHIHLTHPSTQLPFSSIPQKMEIRSEADECDEGVALEEIIHEPASISRRFLPSSAVAKRPPAPKKDL